MCVCGVSILGSNCHRRHRPFYIFPALFPARVQMSDWYADCPSLRPFENQLCHWFSWNFRFSQTELSVAQKGRCSGPAGPPWGLPTTWRLQEEADLDLETT